MSDQVEQPEVQDSGAADQSQAGQDDDLVLDSDAQEESDAPEEEDEEVEIAGRKLAMPKSVAEALKSERMMQADYTRKTQEVAAQRQAVDAEQQQTRQQAKDHQQYIQEYARVVALDDQLAQYQGLNWQDLIDRDPVQAMQFQQQQRTLETQRAQAVQAVEQKQQQDAMSKQQDIAKQVQQAQAYFAKEIPGWTEARNNELSTYAKNQGMDMQVLSKAILRNPSLVKALDKAEKYDRLAQKQTAKPAPTPPPAPVTRVTAAKQATKSQSDMSTDEWMKHRNAQLRKKT